MPTKPACSDAPVAADEFIRIEDVLDSEYRTISDLSTRDKGPALSRDQLMGLAFSGGGIRSATFNLGVLQALAQLKLLTQFDYLSTVSGGGYIGSWLSAWVARADKENFARELQEKSRTGKPVPHTPGIATVQQELSPAFSPADEPEQIQFLRNYSNYLTPKTGLFSTDTLAGIATYVRNFMLNLVILCTALSVILMVPRVAAFLGIQLHTVPLLSLSVGLGALAVAVFFINLNLATQLPGSLFNRERQLNSTPHDPWYVKRAWVIVCIVGSLVVSALFMTCWLAGTTHDRDVLGFENEPLQRFMAAVAIGTVAVWLIWEAALKAAQVEKQTDERPTWWWRLLGLVVGVAIGLAALVWLQSLFARGNSEAPDAIWHTVVWMFPGLLGAFGLAVIFIIGTSGRQFEEDSREWWSRVGGILLAVAIVWIAVSAAAIYGPFAVLSLRGVIQGVGVGWILTTVAGVRAAMSPATGRPGSSTLRDLLAKATPYIFIAGLLVALSYAVHHVLALGTHAPGCPDSEFSGCSWSNYSSWISGWLHTPALWAVWLGCFALMLFFAWRVDVNVFSFHMFYRNRLVRCYLGASNRERKAHPFTGFDGNDSPPIKDLKQRPYHLVNTAINITAGERLAWQERKAASFVMSPLYCGYDLGSVNGMPGSFYQRTDDYVCEVNGCLGLGSALAISGAAASPNQGYHSTPAVAFLLTVFNVRLGWWMQNPSRRDIWRKPGPRFGFRYLVAELFGATDERSKFVYLSDGGHFDNLGIYELVKRRCRFIVACDAGCDPKIDFEDLGNAIRKCKIDLGVTIDIDARVIVPDPVIRNSMFHCAVGTVRYPGASSRRGQGAADNAGDGYEGYLLYIKPSLSGNEPRDVLQYASANPEFPHETTSDQWFAESQFESYRKLGYHITREVFMSAGVDEKLGRESMFVALKQKWHPPSAAVKQAFSRHADQLKLLQAAQKSDPELRFLDAQIYPEWNRLMQGKQAVYPPRLSMPAKASELRAGFYFCSTLLGLMESVYIDLNLEDEYDHPDNRGWVNLFKHWSWSTMVRATYAVCCGTYGARFQTFCRSKLELTPGNVILAATPERNAAVGLCRDRQALESYLEDAEHRSYDLNFEEVRIIRSIASVYQELDELILLRLRVNDPSQPDPDADTARALEFTFGFALTNRKREYVCFRVQDHLRGMGLARLALRSLCKRGYTSIAPDAPVPFDEHQRRFRDLLSSVLREQERTVEAIEAESQK
jgi:predicted acylesterase/phospholipase RssA